MSAQIIPIDKPSKELACSFFRTPQSKAKKLIGSGVSKHCICDECVSKAKQRLEEAKK